MMKSDIFGIGPAVRAVTEIYFRSARGSGRTISMIESLQDGDRVVFMDSRQAKYAERIAQERGKKLDWIVAGVDHPQAIFERGTSKGRTVFDHSWIEAFYLRNLEQAEKAISHWETQASGFGQPHIETRRKAEELARWR